MTEYSMVEAMSEGLVGLWSPEHGPQLWVRCTIRKTHNCARCEQTLRAGAQMYRPVTNGYNRMERMCETCIRLLPACPQRNKKT